MSLVPNQLALFDLDHTLIPLDSDHAWGRFTTRLGWTDAREFDRRNDEFFAQYQRGALDMDAYIRFATQAMREHAGQAEQARARFVDEVIRPVVTAQALELVDSHRRAGARLAIVTATNEWLARPIADLFAIPELLATRLARDGQGAFTGAMDGPACLGAGKLEHVRRWLQAQDLQRADCHLVFYSDSMNDLPLLLHSDQPVAVNPDDRLRAEALRRQWPIVELFDDSIQ